MLRSELFALGEIGDERVIHPLVYCASRPELDIRAAAVEVLGRIANTATLPLLLERLADENTAIKAKAVKALANYPASPDIIERLVPFLKEDDGMLEAEAAIVLGKLGTADIDEKLIPLLSSKHSSTRQAAAHALSVLPL